MALGTWGAYIAPSSHVLHMIFVDLYLLTLCTSREWYGLARFDHPVPAGLALLQSLFPDMLSSSYTRPIFIPSNKGESIADLHNRTAYTLHKIVTELDADPEGPKAIIIATHAATMIAVGRVLTGLMPEDPNDEDFLAYTCSLSRFERKRNDAGEIDIIPEVDEWDRKEPPTIPKLDWQGKGVAGGWDCVLNGETSFLSAGAERGW